MPESDNGQFGDAALVERARAGSVDAFDTLVTRYRRSLYHLAFAMTQSHEAADDLSQEAFVQAFRRIRQLKDPEKFFPWLRRILVNLCVRYSSKAKPVPLEETEAMAGESTSPSAVLERASVKESVRMAVMALDPAERAVVLLYYMEGLKQTEISEALGCPVGTVWSRLSSARSRLREKLADLVS